MAVRPAGHGGGWAQWLTAPHPNGELVDRARLAGELTLIMRYHKPAAVLVPVAWYEEAAELLASAADGPSTARGEANGS